MELRARHVKQRVPITISLNSAEISEVLKGCVSTLVECVRMTVEQTPAEMLEGIAERGFKLKNGGVLQNLDRRLALETGWPVTTIE